MIDGLGNGQRFRNSITHVGLKGGFTVVCIAELAAEQIRIREMHDLWRLF
jgi:hypothetical protein